MPEPPTKEEKKETDIMQGIESIKNELLEYFFIMEYNEKVIYLKQN